MHFVVKMMVREEEGLKVMTFAQTAQEARRIVSILQACHKPLRICYEPYTQA